MKLRGVERATAEPVDMIPPPHLSYQQHPALSRRVCDYSRGDKGR